jgi:uncharacterized integral membrane protein
MKIALALILLSGDPLNPDPTVSADPANTFYSPGIIGFLGTFFVVVGAIALIFDMVRRIRRVRYRADIQERLASEQAAAEAAPKTERKRPAPPAKPKREPKE